MKILIADDDIISLKILSKILSGAGFDLVTAMDGNQVWKILQEPDPPRLLILDWLMPGLTGIDILRKIRKLKDGDSYYLIIQTSLDSSSDVSFALSEGANDFLTKPYNTDILRTKVHVGSRIVKKMEP